MFKTVKDAFKVKEIRDRLIFTLVCLVIVRLGSLIPAPAIIKELYQNWLSNHTDIDLGFLNSLTGGSFEQMSIFALNISPYITASIIVQLLTIAIPKLEELQKDGEDGRKIITKITRYSSIGLAVIESIAMCVGFSNSGYVEGNIVWNILVVTAAFTAGSAFLMWLGERMTEKGVGNGISMILLFNIVAGLPQDMANLYVQFIQDSTVVKGILAAIIIIAVIVVTVVLIVLLQDGQRRIAVQYAKKVQGRKMVGGQSTFIPIKVNTAGVIPVIFSMSLMQFITIISQFCGASANPQGNVWQKILCYLSSRYWFKFSSLANFRFTLGVLLYIGLNIFFAYFYTAITFNPNETANNLKNQSGFIPGIRPGRPTAEYLTKVLNYIIFIGAIGLTVVALIPILVSGAASVSLSFGGTSLIIVVGVVLETMQQIESMMVVRHYRGFLSE